MSLYLLTQPFMPFFQNLTEFWRIPVVEVQDLNTNKLVKKLHIFTLNTEERKNMADNNGHIKIMMKSNLNVHMPVKLGYDLSPINRELGIIYSAFVLIFLYVLIIWEVGGWWRPLLLGLQIIKIASI